MTPAQVYWEFLKGLEEFTKRTGFIITEGNFEYRPNPKGSYKLNPNQGPEFAWDDETRGPYG